MTEVVHSQVGDPARVVVWPKMPGIDQAVCRIQEIPELQPGAAVCRAVRCGSLHNWSVLVHGFHFICEPGCDTGPLMDEHICRDSTR